MTRLLAYAVTEIVRRMADPEREDLEKMIRMAEYALDLEAQVFQVVARPSGSVVCSKLDWTGCRATRQSTAGGVRHEAF